MPCSGRPTPPRWCSRSWAGGGSPRRRRRGVADQATWGDAHRGSRPRRCAGDAPRSTRAGTTAWSTGCHAPDGRTLWIRDLVHVVRGAQGPRAAPRADGGRHRAQAGRAGAAQERAEVLRGVPARARSRAAPARARRHEEHVPRGRLARPADPAHLDPRVCPDAGADPVRTAGGRARPGPAGRLERPEARTPAVRPAGPGSAPARHRHAATATDRSGGAGGHAVDETGEPAGHEITVDVEQVTVAVDAAKVERILENLLSNAIRHTPPGTRSGSARRAGRRRDAGGRRRRPRRSRRPARGGLRAVPSGAGLVSVHSPGVGVGLSLVRRFAELHGGRAWLEAREGGGASFQVFLPGG